MGSDEMLPADTGAPIDTPAAPAAPAAAPAPAAPAAPAAPSEPVKPVSARDSVRAAFDELSKQPSGEEPKAGEPASSAAQLNRDPATGRFAARTAQPAARPGDAPASLAAPAQPDKGAQPAAPAAPSGPPPGWSVASKAAWDQLPPTVRADIAKREGEVTQGLAALRDYKDLKPYAEMAQQSGTTLAAALQRYTTMEQITRRDPVQGLMSIAQNIGLTKSQAAQLFANLASALGARPTPGPQSNGGQPSTGGSDQNDPLAEVIGPLIERALGPMANKLGALETHLSRQLEANQTATERGVAEAIQKFADDPGNRYFADLEETISRLFATGMVERTADAAADLAKAYEMAAQLHPEVREALVSERLKAKAEEAKAKAAAAQKAAVSLNGHPAGGAAAPPRPVAGQSVHASVRAAFDQLRAGV